MNSNNIKSYKFIIFFLISIFISILYIFLLIYYIFISNVNNKIENSFNLNSITYLDNASLYGISNKVYYLDARFLSETLTGKIIKNNKLFILLILSSLFW